MLGTGKDCGSLPLQLYAELLRERVCRAVIFWYALTRCYTVSHFLERAKPTAWKTWKTFLEVTDNFIKLSKLIKTWKIQVGLWITKTSSSQYGQNYGKHHKHAKNWNTAPVLGFVSVTVVEAKNTAFRALVYATAKDNVKTRLIYGLCLMTSVML